MFEINEIGFVSPTQNLLLSEGIYDVEKILEDIN